MKQRSAAAVISFWWIGVATLPALCQAQTLTTLASFAGPNGSTPVAGLVGGNGVYGNPARLPTDEQMDDSLRYRGT